MNAAVLPVIMTPEEFTTLISASGDKMYRFALRMLNDSGRAKDAVQDVCMKLWRQRDQLQSIDNLEAWCMRLTRNRCIDFLRSPANRVNGLEHSADQKAAGKHPDSLTEQNDTMERITRLMKKLPAQQRMAMHLRDIEGMSYKEIAEVLDLSMAQVKITIFRARKAVRIQLENANAYGL